MFEGLNRKQKVTQYENLSLQSKALRPAVTVYK